MAVFQWRWLVLELCCGSLNHTVYKADETGHLREPFPPRYHILACTSYPYLQLLYGTVMVLVGHNYQVKVPLYPLVRDTCKMDQLFLVALEHGNSVYDRLYFFHHYIQDGQRFEEILEMEVLPGNSYFHHALCFLPHQCTVSQSNSWSLSTQCARWPSGSLKLHSYNVG